MNDKNVQRNDELESEDHWDFDAAEMRPGVAKPRAVVSVAFAREDFERVSECAESQRMRTSEFIREAALEKAARSSFAMTTSSSSGPQRVETRLSTPNQIYMKELPRSGVGVAYSQS